MYPKEKVASLLKKRESMRNLNREAYQFTGNQTDLTKIKRCHSTLTKDFAQAFEKKKSTLVKQFKTIELINKIETGCRNNFPNRQK